MKQFALMLVAVLLIAGCETSQTNTAPVSEGAVQFTTADGWVIHGIMYNGTGRNLLLLHGLGDHSAAWAEFARVLKDKGYTVLAIDMRGHGKSTIVDGANKTWNKFTTADYASMPKDAAAAQQFMGNENISIIGASIGGNIALNYAAQSNKVTSLVLLSPGLDFQGITTEEAMRLYKGSVFLAAGEIDSYSADSANRLYVIAKGKRKIELYNTGNHGTQLLKDQAVQDAVLAWLAENYPAARPASNATNVTVSKR